MKTPLGFFRRKATVKPLPNSTNFYSILTMTDQELRSQRNKARANLELMQLKARSGLVSQAALEEAKQVYQALVAYQMPVGPVTPNSPPGPASALVSPPRTDEQTIELPKMPVGEFTRLLEELTLQKSAFHKEMAIRCNQLKDIPDNESAKDLVDDIDRFYDLRTEVAVKINFLKANGRLPEDLGNADAAAESVADHQLKYLENLPADKYELSRMLALTMPNLSKARTALERATSPVKKLHYSQKVAKLEVEVALLRSRMAALS